MFSHETLSKLTTTETHVRDREETDMMLDASTHKKISSNSYFTPKSKEKKRIFWIKKEAYSLESIFFARSHHLYVN